MLLLFALLVAFGVGYFLYQQEQRLALGVWPDLTIDAVQSIEVATPHERYTLMRDAGGWVVRLDGGEADAVPVPADATRVEALLTAISQNRPRQTLDPASGVDTSQLGFDSPTVQMLIKPSSSDDRAARVTLGHETPTGAALYAHSSLAPDAVFLMCCGLPAPPEAMTGMRTLLLTSRVSSRS